MNYTSTKTIQSKVCDGASFSIKRINRHRRDQLNDLVRPIEEKLRPIREEIADLNKRYHEAKEAKDAHPETPAFPDDQFRRLLEVSEQFSRIDRREMTPETLRYCVTAIDGLEIDGKPATVDSLIEAGSDDLYDEIALAVARELGLLPEEKENLPSASTSAAVVDGNQSNGSAAPVETPATTTPAVAESTTDPGSASVPSTSNQQ